MAHEPANSLLSQVRRLFSATEAQRLPDRQLLESFVRDRDQTAFGALVQRHGPMVQGVCRSVLGNHEDARDAYQATFLVLARRASAVRRPASLASWLHGVAHRLSLKARTLDARRRARERLATPATQTPMDDLTWRELRGALHEELARLRDRHRSPLVLCYLEGKTLEEAAQQLGWSATTLKGRLDRARKILRDRLARRGLALSVPLLAALLPQSDAAAALVEGTIQATKAFLSGQAAPALSSRAAALAERGLRGLPAATARRRRKHGTWLSRPDRDRQADRAGKRQAASGARRSQAGTLNSKAPLSKRGEGRSLRGSFLLVQ